MVVAVLTWLVIIGGISSIGRAMEKLAPLKVGLYLAGGAFVIVSFADRLPTVLALVIREAWTTESAMGFGIFVAMRYGIARGIYANEAGYRHRGRRVRNGPIDATVRAGAAGGDGGLHRVVRHGHDQRDDDPAERRGRTVDRGAVRPARHS